MRRWVAAAVFLGFAVSTAGAAADGKKVFEASGCGACHKVKEDGTGPSLVKIAAKYGNKRADLDKFLAGAAKPMVDASKVDMMKPNLAKLQPLSKGEKGALADYILSQK